MRTYTYNVSVEVLKQVQIKGFCVCVNKILYIEYKEMWI